MPSDNLKITDEGNRKRLDKIAKVIIIGASILLVFKLVTPDTKTSTMEEIRAQKSGYIIEETTTVYLGRWIEIQTDPTRERLSFNPKGTEVDYQLVVDGDFKNPYYSTREKPLQNLPGNVYTLHAALIGRRGPAQHPFLLERIPK